MPNPLEESLNQLQADFDALKADHEALKSQVETVDNNHTKYFNDLRDFGPLDGRVNPETDNTNALRQSIVNSNENDMPIYIAGDAVIKDTIELPFQNGYKFIGSGSRPLVNVKHPFDASGSSLNWRGEAGGTMFKIQGSDVVFDDIAIYGKAWERYATPEGRAGIGLLVTKPEVGLGTGKISFKNFKAYQCDVGIQFGENYGMSNCDVSTFSGLTYFHNCESGFKIVNAMGMGFHFDMVFSRDVKKVFDIQAGGGVEISNAAVVSLQTEAFLNFGKSEINNCHVKVGQVKRDAQADNCKFVNMEEPGLAKILFDQIHTSMGSQRIGEVDFDLKGSPTLCIRGHNKMQAGAIRVTGGSIGNKKCVIVLDNCRLNMADPKSVISADTDTAYTLFVKNCYNNLGYPKEDKTYIFSPVAD